MDWKLDLYKKIAPSLRRTPSSRPTPRACPSPSSVRGAARGHQAALLRHPLLQPPRYMALVELINTPTTQARVLDDLEAFVTSTLGKGVVRATDSPTSSPTASASPACWPP